MNRIDARLSADLKLPGRGWLEFEVRAANDGRSSEIRQTALFDPRGLAGRLYWLATIPIHAMLFRGLLRNIGRRGQRMSTPTAGNPIVRNQSVRPSR